ncbi:MAG: ABC transporter substrate-binding protein [Verrucomicrobiae bacterium]|nr:ABC transporter substrate-binding protein [Verrucomicrobiae bacterium]MDW7979414.1 ABC transporter substrate-binding protein [Verrucomicrobiales bacterium]
MSGLCSQNAPAIDWRASARRTAGLIALCLGFGLVCGVSAGDRVVVRVGHFPNLTHAQAVIGHALTRQGRGWFEERLGTNVQVQWYVYNAGPSAMEAIFAGSLDLTYVGPNPAINAYLRSEGKEVRIVAGVCSGGAALVVQPDGRIRTDSDFRGKRVGTPQLGNTQDVAARAWLLSKGHRVTLTGGDVLVVPTPNPDQLALFRKGALDAVWTVEPWVSRLVLEAGGEVYLEEKTLWSQTGGRYVTTHLVSSVRFLDRHPDLVKKWVAAHVELTQWIKANPAEAKKLLNDELKAETGRGLAAEVLERAWDKIELTWDPVPESLAKSAEDAYRIGFLKVRPELAGIYELRFLNEVLAEKNLPRLSQ